MPMIKSEKTNYMLWAWLLIAGFTIGRILYAQSFPLVPDETNYWQWSRYLSWGYYDQSPMIAWSIRLFTNILGHTELAVRLPSIISLTIASVYLVLIAKHWFSARVAWHTALLTQSVFIFNAGAVLATADGLQGAGWAAASYHVARGFENNQWRHWIAGGLWFGFGLLSKYTMVLFLPFVFVFGLLRYRHRLWAFRPYIGCVFGLMMFIPVIAWNAANDWNSVRHVAYLSGANQQFQIHFKLFAEYIGSQFGLITPLVFGMVCAGWIWVVRNWKREDRWIYSYLFLTSFPMIAGFALLSLHTRVYGNWPCAGYLTACVLCAALFSKAKDKSGSSKRRGVRPIWVWSVASSFFLTALVFTHLLFHILPIPGQMDRTVYEVRGWKELGLKVGDTQRAMPDPRNTFLFGLRYQIASELAFYVPNNPLTVSINRWSRPNVYDFWWQDGDLIAQDAVGVLYDGDSRGRLREVFDRVDSPVVFHVYSPYDDQNKLDNRTPITTFYIYRCYGFKGGLRWQPPDSGDIRASDI